MNNLNFFRTLSISLHFWDIGLAYLIVKFIYDIVSLALYHLQFKSLGPSPMTGTAGRQTTLS